jgi:hypothetical protein
MKRYSRKEAQRLVLQFRTKYPNLFDTHDEALTPRKLTKRERELEIARADARMAGYTEAQRRYEDEKKRDAESIKKQREQLHLDTLRQIRDMYSSFGQMMQVLARAMESEKGQL